MTIGTVPDAGIGRVADRPAWKALDAHHRDVSTVHLRELFARDPGRGERLTAEAAGIYLDYSKNRITDETLRLLVQLAEESGLRARIDAMFRGEKINVTENRAVLHVALRAPRGASIVVDGEERRARGPRGARPDGRLRQPRPQRRVEGPHRQAHPQRRQHRHRRLGSRAGHGLRGAAALQRPQPHLPLRLERRRHRLRRSGPRSRSGGDAVHRLLEDLHDAGDDDQRPHRARVVAGRAWAATRRRSPSTSSPSRPTPRRCRSSASTPPTCSGSGTGSAAATRWTRRSASRRCSPSARTTSARCSPASTRWTSTSAPRRSSATCPC